MALLPITCLIKHPAFEAENECRIIYITHILNGQIFSPQDYKENHNYYMNYQHIKDHIDHIWLGPQCQAQHNTWINLHARQINSDRKNKSDQTIKIKNSDIGFK